MEKLELFCWALLFWSTAISSAQSRLLVGDSQFRYVDPFGSILLDCSTPDNSSVGCRVGWLKGAGSRVLNDSHHTVYCNGSLKIRNVTGPLVGVDKRYRCYDMRGVFEDSRSIFIELKNLPTPIVRDVLVVEGHDASLTCNVDGARPHPSEIKWYHNGILVENERFSELSFTNLNRNQSGNYTCVVRIDDDTATGSGILTVAYIDITNTTPMIITALVNTSGIVRFGCQASGVPMVTNITWIYPPDVRFQQHALSVNLDNTIVARYGDVVGRIEFKHSGWYKCRATNNVTRNSAVFRLLVKGPPDPPYGLTLLSLSAYEAQVAWIVPFDGNDLITEYFVFVWNNISNFTVATIMHVLLLRRLQPNTRYQYRVIAQNGYGNGTSSDDGEFTTLSLAPPSPPSNVQVTVLNSTAVNVSWEIPLFNSSVGTILYTSVQYKQWDNSVVTKKSLNWQRFSDEWTVYNATSVVIRGLAKGTSYAFIVCLGNKEGKGPCEEVYEITPKTVPSVPVVEVMVVSSYSVQISWSVRDDGGNTDLSYTLTRWTDRGSSPVVLFSVSMSDDGQYLVDHLMPITSYWFSVVAHSDSGDSAEGWSTHVVTNPLPPGIPTSLTVIGNIIRWLPSNVADNNTGTATFYLVQLTPFDFPSSTIMIRTSETTVDLTEHVTPGNRYRVRVRADNTGGMSNWSDPVMFAAVNQPANPTVGSASSLSHDRDKIVIAVVCTSVSVVVIIVIMIVIFFVLYHKRQTILHTYKINSIVELDDNEQERNTFIMITDNDKPHPSNDQTSVELNEQDVDKSSLYQIDTRAGDMQMTTMTIDDRSKTPSPLMILPVRIALSTETTDV